MKEPRKRRPRPMKLELYLDKINQEMIRSGDLRAGCDFYVSWEKSCCILDFGRIRPDDLVTQPALAGRMLRKEPEGGMMWDPRTGAVYKLDEDAYHALLELDRGFSEKEVAVKLGLTLGEVQSLTSKLRQLAP